MKKQIFYTLSCMLYFGSLQLNAQWNVGGNNLAANGSIGSNTNFSVIFKSFNTEHGRLTNTGLWGFGINAPNSKLHVSSIAGQNPLRVDVAGTTRFLVHSGGGAAIGTTATPPTNGLVVGGNTGMGTSAPENKLHILKASAGVVTGHVNAPLIVENSTNCYINLLAPNANETGILFGNPASNVSGGIIYNNGNNMNFRTFNNTTRMTLTAGGNFGIGTTLPAVKLHVAGGGDAGLASGGYIVSGSTTGENIVMDDNEIMARNNGAASTLFLNHNGGDLIINGTNVDGSNVAIGTTTPASDLHIVHENGFISNGLTLTDNFAANLSWNIYSATTGELWFSNNGVRRGTIDGTSGAYTSSSDKKLKKDINEMENVLDRVLQLKPSLYRFNGQPTTDNRKYIGMIAQDVLPLFPEAVYQHNGKNDGTDDFLTLDYTTFGIIGIKAIQEQQQKITSLEDKIAKLEAAINKLTGNNQMISTDIKGASLEQNQPNPFNQATIIRYSIPTGAKAQINVFDAQGRMVKNLTAPESGQVTINGSDLKAGTYTYRLIVNDNMAISKKMVLLR